MAIITTAYKQFNDSNNARTWSLPGHTVLKPLLAIQRRVVPQGNKRTAKTELSFVAGTVDADSLTVAEKHRITVTVDTAVYGASADMTALLVLFREAIASDEFTAAVSSQDYVK